MILILLSNLKITVINTFEVNIIIFNKDRIMKLEFIKNMIINRTFI
ncbi:hypothetical protein B0H39_002490 [Clostridium beijerinckii]|nr:hypothetical protein [Clostridium beijerinckii]NOW84609.1 hypothetical protein [Clostridium beijerinckii]